ncbi:ABC-F family ATP-binding cassette domain-containing protein [Haloimpatiens massiliensis]|uniref:ABC-F family ATP-binding cassette domain-containing protein n=1 Tax=Haloimpatiens massiliensis TaxID=1658110 RepID=UPI000C8671A4|nr:ABC-F family ATP-binding cassette domain-containing protein [Haloimpatiens massiliensis]
MNLITLENINKSYGEKVLLKQVSLGINEGEKIGLIGINGTGKSTLLKIIAGVENFDEGNVIKKNKLIIEYLNQSMEFQEELTVIQQIFKGDSPVMKVLREYEEIMDSIEKNPENLNLQSKLMEITSKIDALDAWSLESNAKIILTKLGINDFNAKVGKLSGGQRKRIVLAGALIRPCDILILDEPTNHLDNETIKWLEEYLNSRKGSLIMITHDRYFLDRVTNRILELNRGNLYSYEGNYSLYLNAKVERQELEKSLEQKRQNLYRRELAWIRRGVKARGTKQKARVDRFKELVAEEGYVDDENMDICVGSTRLGKKVIIAEEINKSFGDKKIIKDFNFILSGEDRVGIIGNNGLGKSTLLNILSGNIKADKGIIDVGETVQIGYFSQEYTHMDENMRAIEYIREAGEFIKTADGHSISASQMMERFLFSGDIQYAPIGKLSGGEKRRLQLLRVLMYAPNVLFLDEPTNDLDIDTLNILENYIENFEGAVVTVSHDRYFLDKIANKILAFRGNGEVLEHTGNYSDYVDFLEKTQQNSCVEDGTQQKLPKDKQNGEKYKKNEKEKSENNDLKNSTKPSKIKFSYKEQREYEKIDEVIEGVEKNLSEIEEKINSTASDYTLLQELLAKNEELESELLELMERWEYLNEIAEKIKNQS